MGGFNTAFCETIEMSCSSAREEHPEGDQKGVARNDPSRPVLIQDDDSSSDDQSVVDEMGPAPREEPCNNNSTGRDSANDIAHISACPPSCAEMEEMLRQISHGSEVDLPLSQMFETMEMV